MLCSGLRGRLYRLAGGKGKGAKVAGGCGGREWWGLWSGLLGLSRSLGGGGCVIVWLGGGRGGGID